MCKKILPAIFLFAAYIFPQSDTTLILSEWKSRLFALMMASITFSKLSLPVIDLYLFLSSVSRLIFSLSIPESFNRVRFLFRSVPLVVIPISNSKDFLIRRSVSELIILQQDTIAKQETTCSSRELIITKTRVIFSTQFKKKH